MYFQKNSVVLNHNTSSKKKIDCYCLVQYNMILKYPFKYKNRCQFIYVQINIKCEVYPFNVILFCLDFKKIVYLVVI